MFARTLAFVAPVLLGSLTTVRPAAAAPGPGLNAAAAASGRPRECSGTAKRTTARGPTVWNAARIPTLERYCDLVARAQAELGSRPEAAKKTAMEAEEALPGHASPAVILARALLALGDAAGAEKTFDRARSIDARSVEEPLAMHDYARCLAKMGKREASLLVYRKLVPRVDLLSAAARIAVLLEAAHASMAVAAEKSEKAPKLDEATAYLREAKVRPPTELTGDVLLSLALVLDRAGDREQADAALADAGRNSARLRGSSYLAFSDDKLALEALALDATDRAGAQKAWEAFLSGSGGKGPWAHAAKARLEATRRGGTSRGGRGARK